MVLSGNNYPPGVYLIKLMNELGYPPITEKGLCLGLVFTILFAEQAYSFETWSKRLKVIAEYSKNMSVEELAREIERLQAVEEIKTLSDNEKILRSINTFFDPLIILHKTQHFSYLFPPEEKTSIQNPNKSLSVTLPMELEKGGGVHMAAIFSQGASLKQLKNHFLTTFPDFLKKWDHDYCHPISFVFSNLDHAVYASYNHHDWLFFDSGNLLGLSVKSPLTASAAETEFFTALTLNDRINFYVRVYIACHIYIVPKEDTSEIKHPCAYYLIKDKSSWKLLKTNSKREVNEIPLATIPKLVETLDLFVNADPKKLSQAQQKTLREPIIAHVYHGFSESLEKWQETFPPPTLEEANQADSSNLTWAQVAARIGDKKSLQLLMNLGVNLSGADTQKNSFLQAVSANQVPVIKLLTEYNKQLLQSTTFKLETSAMGVAAEKGHVEVIEYLFRKGVSVNEENKVGQTPLYLASLNGRAAAVQMLIDTGKVNINAENNKGMTPLLIAAQKGHVEVIKILLKNGANPNVADFNDNTPLFMACKWGHPEIVKLLLIYKADKNISKGKLTPIKLIKHKLSKSQDIIDRKKNEAILILLNMSSDEIAQMCNEPSPLNMDQKK